MTLFDTRDGYYDDTGVWNRTKFCFVSCGVRCTCGPPGGIWYNPALDKRQNVCREHITTPHPACPTCAAIARPTNDPTR